MSHEFLNKAQGVLLSRKNAQLGRQIDFIVQRVERGEFNDDPENLQGNASLIERTADEIDGILDSLGLVYSQDGKTQTVKGKIRGVDVSLRRTEKTSDSGTSDSLFSATVCETEVAGVEALQLWSLFGQPTRERHFMALRLEKA